MRETGKYLTMIEVLFFEHVHVYFVPDIGTLARMVYKTQILALWAPLLGRGGNE